MGMNCSKQGENFHISEDYCNRKNKKVIPKVATAYEEDSQELLVFRDFSFAPSKENGCCQNTMTEESAFSKGVSECNTGIGVHLNAKYAKDIAKTSVQIEMPESINPDDMLGNKEKEASVIEYAASHLQEKIFPLSLKKTINPNLSQKDKIEDHYCLSPGSNKLYKLHGLQGKQNITSQDLNQLMNTICSTVGQNLSMEDSESNGKYLKICLEIGNENSRSDTKVANKYTPTKTYNGFTFPPPNSEEAEKVNDYISKKLSFHESKHSSRGINRHMPRGRHCTKCHHNSNQSSASSRGSKNKENRFVIPRRNDYCDGEERFRTRNSNQNAYNCKRENHDCRCSRLAVRRNSSSSSSVSGTLPPQYSNEQSTKYDSVKCDENSLRIRNREDTRHSIKSNDNSLKAYNDRTYKMRFPHLCPFNKVKGRLKHPKFNPDIVEKPDIRQELKLPPGKPVYDDTCGFFHKGSIPNHNWSHVQSLVDCNCKVRSGIDLMGWDKSSIHKKYYPSSSPPENNNVSNISLKYRPEVWPGKCSETNYNNSFMGIKPQCHAKTPICSDEICYCNKVTGMESPRHHSKTVYHSHKHEYYHYHYYITQATH